MTDIEHMLSKTYSVKRVSEIMEVTPYTVRDWIKRGLLKAERPKGTRNLRIHEDDLKAFIETKYPGVNDE